MDKARDGWRTKASLVVPGAVAFVFIALSSRRPIENRLLAAAVAGIAVEIVGAIAVVLATFVATRLLGEPDPDETLPPMRYLLAGMLVAAGFWTWWQYNRDTTVTRIASCVGDTLRDNVGQSPRDAVIECYREPVEDLADDQP